MKSLISKSLFQLYVFVAIFCTCRPERSDRNARGLHLIRLGKRGLSLIRLGKRFVPSLESGDEYSNGLLDTSMDREFGYPEDDLEEYWALDKLPLDEVDRQITTHPRIGRDVSAAESDQSGVNEASTRKRRSLAEQSSQQQMEEMLQDMKYLSSKEDLYAKERAITQPRFGRREADDMLTRSITQPRFGRELEEKRGMGLIRLGKRAMSLIRLGRRDQQSNAMKRAMSLIRLGKKSDGTGQPSKKAMSLIRLGRSSQVQESHESM